MSKEKRQPESEDALDALETVLKTTKKKNFLESHIIPLKTDSKNEKRRKMILSIAFLIMFLSLLVLLWLFVIDPAISDKTNGGLQEIHGTADTVQTDENGNQVATTREPKIVRQTYDALKQRNSEYVGWLTVPGAEIDLPVVQTKNNNYYLYRDFDTKQSRYGNPFMDYRNNINPLDSNLIVYGHHMKNGKIFGQLQNYTSKATAIASPIITLELRDVTYQYKIFAVIRTNGASSGDLDGYVFRFDTPRFPTEENFAGYIRQLKQRTLYNTGVDVQYGDHLISLQTCLYDYPDEFLVVVGRLVRPGESLKLDPNLVHSNANPRMPQAYYDKRDRKNPFANAEKWYPVN
ncbi:MAG: class B sortase [Oscillospiraceae bacterium]|jgi:sortase B|nr:class B sortase [Oscillospiraceae bacterium]